MTESLFDWTPSPKERTWEDRFWAFHAANPHVYGEFCRFADQAIASGRKHLSSSMIFERIRWETMIQTRGEGSLKLNNNFQPFYARLWLRNHPDKPEFFRLRQQKREASI